MGQTVVFNKIDEPVLGNLIFLINFYFLVFVTSWDDEFHSDLLLGVSCLGIHLLNVR